MVVLCKTAVEDVKATENESSREPIGSELILALIGLSLNWRKLRTLLTGSQWKEGVVGRRAKKKNDGLWIMEPE